MNKLVQFFVAGVVVVAAIRLFKFEQELSDRVIVGVKSREPEGMVMAAGLVLVLGVIAVTATQAFKKVS